MVLLLSSLFNLLFPLESPVSLEGSVCCKLNWLEIYQISVTGIVWKRAVDFDSQRTKEKRPMLMETDAWKMFEGESSAVLCEARV